MYAGIITVVSEFRIGQPKKAGQISVWFYLVLLNTCMKNTDNETNKWLQQNGINASTFTKTRIKVLQAQKIAHTLLKEHGRLLSQNEAATLNNFLRAANNHKLRDKITDGQCYKVMNIGTTVNRKLFKAYKAI